ncbi:uncharacterized protein THITE_2093465 [Thermothielavioides terrestris NRRL 8126]|uniref:VIT domain-containing protein n=1 Tax=Thermothielavioides terrestris (strain ATCC 38088 / NRRL 8126) TaxID=578455 RepID=G2RH32_THETT|nr:uncharacterized protein THITE_2093465 [Thermothielavioides terrestris NRRL 8126]AEO71963.1 hypothetical protein THITE_2093465 [Thermothielavioides terrestris NRRL 8126]
MEFRPPPTICEPWSGSSSAKRTIPPGPEDAILSGGDDDSQSPISLGHCIPDLKHLDFPINAGAVVPFPARMKVFKASSIDFEWDAARTANQGFTLAAGPPLAIAMGLLTVKASIRLAFARSVQEHERYARLDTYFVQPNRRYVEQCLKTVAQDLAVRVDKVYEFFDLSVLRVVLPESSVNDAHLDPIIATFGVRRVDDNAFRVAKSGLQNSQDLVKFWCHDYDGLGIPTIQQTNWNKLTSQRNRRVTVDQLKLLGKPQVTSNVERTAEHWLDDIDILKGIKRRSGRLSAELSQLRLKTALGRIPVVEPKKKAREEFEKAKRSEKKRAAALLEELTPEIFETALGNIPPDTTVTVKLRYVHELKAVVMKHEKAEGLAITIPTSIAPRYGGSARLTSLPGVAEKSLKIWVRVVNNGVINVEGCQAESGYDVCYQGTERVPTPVVVGGLAELAYLQAPRVAETPQTQSTLHEQRLRSRAVLEPADRTGHAALMVRLRPNDLFASAVRPQSFAGELLFVLDRSDSMGWTEDGYNTLKIDTLRDAMTLALAGLPDTCAFNILSFGSTVRGMWPESKTARDADNVKHARKYVSSVAADMGGTAVEPQKQILKFVWETRRGLGDRIRFFTLGIGDRVSHRMLESIAELGGGYCDVIDVVQRPRWEDRLNRMLRSAMEPDSWSCDIALGPGYERRSLTTSRFAQGSPGGESQGDTQPCSAYFQAPCPVPPLHPYTYKSVFFLLDFRGGRSPPAGVTVTTTTPGALAAVVDTLMMMQYFETRLAGERDSWHLLMDKAERSVLLRLGFDEDQDDLLTPLYEMLALSIAHVHFDEAVDAAVKTCRVCDRDFDGDAWPESGNRAFVCWNDDCYGRGTFDTWDSFWDHQVKSGHQFCPGSGFGESGEFD